MMNLSVAIVGRGRMGTALHASLLEAGVSVHGPFSKDEVRAGALDHANAHVVLLAVPDSAIETVARHLTPGAIVGHLSGATPLAVLEPHERFVLHPLLTVTGDTSRFRGAVATVSGSTDRARETADRLAETLGMRHMPLAESNRSAYHAAASVASNFLMTVLGFAEDLARVSGIDRAALAPLVRESVANWERLGARDALTGPIVRGDDGTVARQRDAVAEHQPEHLDLFDSLVTATKALATPQ